MGVSFFLLLAQVEQEIKPVVEQTVEQPEPSTWMSLQGVIWLLVILLAAFVMLRIARQRVLRSQALRGMPVRDRVARRVGSQENRTVNQISELMAALADLSRQINGQIDTRLAKLETLLEQADAVIKRLEKGDLNTESGACEAIKEISDSFHHSAAELSPDSREVLELTEQGMDKISIAQKLDRPIGEIELILALAGTKGVIGEKRK